MVTTRPSRTPGDRTVCIMGLGYVGLTLATTMAEVGFDVYGIERDEALADRLQSGDPHFFEPGMAERLNQALHDKQLKISTTIPAECPATVYIVAVGTPLGPDQRVRTDIVETVAAEIAGRMKDGDMVVVRSTVKIGTTRGIILPILESSGKDFDLAFCPERTQEARALEELRQLPQIVAGYTKRANDRAAQLFQAVTPTIIRVSDLETGEVIKMVDNAHRDVYFAFANEVARICDAVGISALEVIQSGKLGYPRTNLPLPGTVGGPCLTKDPYILAESLEEFGVEPEITLAARHLNERLPKEAVAHIAGVCSSVGDFPSDPTIALMGLAFKGRPPTDDVRGTTARLVLDELREAFPQGRFRGFDAMVSDAVIQGFALEPHSSIESAMTDANLVVILNNHPDFAAMPLEEHSDLMARPGLIYDFWNQFTDVHLRLADSVSYIALGSHGRRISGPAGR
ncbi:MAG TPA: nucleotide sugar dehydrogenase [Actinomycetota bacterium]|nr:nucleotide sugar dehydrogenase [Actinomycetota bacterium]